MDHSEEEEFVNGLETAIRQIMSEVHCSFPATVLSVSSDGRMVSVLPTHSKLIADGRILPSPAIYNVPFMWPRSSLGNAGLTMPIAVNDTVLVHVTDRQLDVWLHGSTQQTVPDDPRQHHMTDAVAVPGLYPYTKDLQEVDTTSVVLFFNQASISIQPNGKIKLTSVEINADCNIVTTGDVIAGEISLQNHEHGQVKGGDEITGPPV